MGHKGLQIRRRFTLTATSTFAWLTRRSLKALLPNNGDSFLWLGDCDVTVHVCDQGPGLIVIVKS